MRREETERLVTAIQFLVIEFLETTERAWDFLADTLAAARACPEEQIVTGCRRVAVWRRQHSSHNVFVVDEQRKRETLARRQSFTVGDPEPDAAALVRLEFQIAPRAVIRRVIERGELDVSFGKGSSGAKSTTASVSSAANQRSNDCACPGHWSAWPRRSLDASSSCSKMSDQNSTSNWNAQDSIAERDRSCVGLVVSAAGSGCRRLTVSPSRRKAVRVIVRPNRSSIVMAADIVRRDQNEVRTDEPSESRSMRQARTTRRDRSEVPAVRRRLRRAAGPQSPDVGDRGSIRRTG